MTDNLPYERFARAMREYFSPRPYENEVFLLLLLPTICILLWLLFSRQVKGRRIVHSEKDLDFFEQARIQRGLEEFDRDFLLDLAETYNVLPAYKLLIDREKFDTLERTMEKSLERKADKDQTALHYLRGLKRKLFV